MFDVNRRLVRCIKVTDMEQDEIVLRKGKDYYRVFMVIAGIGIVVTLAAGYFEVKSLTDAIAWVVVLLLCIAVFIISKKGLKDRSADIVISSKGVFLAGKGMYPWHLIESFSTTEEDNDGIRLRLILHFSQYEDEDYMLTGLNIKLDTLIEYMLFYKGTYKTYYAGHKEINL